jgi:NTP pyrophosphatase (non-canonical NTP hydrolase)
MSKPMNDQVITNAMTGWPCISEDTAEYAIEVHVRLALPNVGTIRSDEDIRFCALSMAGEAGEAANIVKKAWRDGTPLNRQKLAEEIAGTACYLIGLANAIDLDLDAEMMAQMRAFEARPRAISSGERADG